jgi:hypothetical protein
VIPCALRRIGYRVVAIDIEPEPYVGTTECCSVEAVKRDLERPFAASLEQIAYCSRKCWDVNVKCINQVSRAISEAL